MKRYLRRLLYVERLAALVMTPALLLFLITAILFHLDLPDVLVGSVAGVLIGGFVIWVIAEVVEVVE